jgi:hypothetical protein
MFYSAAGSIAESVAAAEEAAEIFQRFLPYSSDVGPMLVSSLHTLGLGLQELGDPLASAAAFAKAVETLAPLASNDPSTFADWWLELRDNLRQAITAAGLDCEGP